MRVLCYYFETFYVIISELNFQKGCIKVKILKSCIYLSLICVNLNATSLRDSVEDTISTNPEILSEYFNKSKIKQSWEEQKGSYLPQVDLSVRFEKSDLTEDKDNSVKKELEVNGQNKKLEVNQLIYDGGKTPNTIAQYRHRYYNIKHKSDQKIEDLILELTKSYNDLVSYQELMALDDYKLKVHQKYLKLAKQKEEISGEILDVYLVNSKIKAIVDNYIEQEVKQQKAFSSYKKLTGKELKGNICRPTIDESLIPPTLEEAIDIALQNNSKILAQNELIKEQISKVKVELSKYAPTLNFEASAEHDSDIAYPDNGDKEIYTLGLQFNWNLYNGGRDSKVIEQERIAILEEKKKLQVIKDEVTDEIKSAYNTYEKVKKRIKNIKEYILDNKAIVEIYNRQLQDGSRTFLDLLNAESELFRTKILLTDTEFLQLKEYFNILRSLDILSDTILTQKPQQCEKFVFNEPILKLEKPKVKTYEELSQELGLE